MINLLPTDYRQDLLYGRRNLRLIRWIGIIWVVVLGVALITLFGQFYIGQSTKKLEKSVQETQNRITAQKLENYQKDLEELNNNFKITSQLLGKQILFSELLKKLGSTIPNGTVVSQVALTDKNVGGEGVIIEVRATTQELANQTFINISDPKNNLFEDADILEIGKVGTSGATSNSSYLDNYPYAARIQVKFKAGSDLIMLNRVKAGL